MVVPWIGQKASGHYPILPEKRKCPSKRTYKGVTVPMESSTSKTEVMKPLFLRAGIPLVLSVAGFVCVRIMARRKQSSLETKVSNPEIIDSHEEFRNEASCPGVNSTSSPIEDDEENMISRSSHFLSSIERSDEIDEIDFQEGILGIRNKIEELQNGGQELEVQFLLYHVMKEQEFVLMELKNKLLLETARIEFLDSEISSMEAEKQRFENLVVKYLEVLEKLEFTKQENGLLQRKVKKLLRKTREQSRFIREKNLKIEATEAEILRCCNELERSVNITKKLEDEVRELRTIANQLQVEKNELLFKLNSAENSSSSVSKIEEEGKLEDYNQLANELEQLIKDGEAEVTELINLRWNNAFLRQESMRRREDEIQEEKNSVELKLRGSGQAGDGWSDHQQDGTILGHGEPCLDGATGNQDCSKRRSLLRKFKRWVERSNNMKSKLGEKEKHEIKCFGRLSVSQEAKEQHPIHVRRSYSSV